MAELNIDLLPDTRPAFTNWQEVTTVLYGCNSKAQKKKSKKKKRETKILREAEN